MQTKHKHLGPSPDHHNHINQEEAEDGMIMVADKYIIEKKIGKGSFGEVYKGFDIHTKQ